jgi:hemolysin D
MANPFTQFRGSAMRPEIDFLAAALEIQEKPPSPAGRGIIWAIVLFFSLAVAWAFIGEIDIVATAQGRIIPSGRVKVIQPMDIGVVRRIPVREGQQVQAGDILIELDPTATEADLERLEMELTAARLDEARYRALERVTDDPAEGDEAAVVKLGVPPSLAQESDASAIALQERLLQSAWSEHRARCAALDNTIVSLEAELGALKEEVKKRAGTLPLITRRAGAVRKMVDRQLSAEQTWLELEEKRVEQQQELAASKKRTRKVEASIQETREQRQAVDAEFRRELLTKLSEAERRIDQLQQERVKASRRAGRRCGAAACRAHHRRRRHPGAGADEDRARKRKPGGRSLDPEQGHRFRGGRSARRDQDRDLSLHPLRHHRRPDDRCFQRCDHR